MFFLRGKRRKIECGMRSEREHAHDFAPPAPVLRLLATAALFKQNVYPTRRY